MARENNSIFWMFAFVIFFFWILTKHTIQTSAAVTQKNICQLRNAVTQNQNICAQGIPAPSCTYQTIVPVPITPAAPAVSSTSCGTPAQIVAILASYEETGTIKPVCALTLCFYNKYLAKVPNATPCQKRVFAAVAYSASGNSVSNTPISPICILQRLTGIAGRA